MSNIKWKPKDEQIRVIYSGSPSGVDSVVKNPGKVFAVIGPFENHGDRPELADAIEYLIRGYNVDAD